MRKLNVHNLRKSLDQLCEKLSSFYINYGGCCYLSYLIAYHLDKLDIKYKLIIFSYSKKELKEIITEITDKRRGPSKKASVIKSGTCNHYSIFLEGGGMLNAGYFKENCKRYFIKNVTSSDIKWIYRMGYWNSVYNTSNNKRIRKILNTFFNNYEEKKDLSNY